MAGPAKHSRDGGFRDSAYFFLREMIMRLLFSIRALCLILVLAFASPAAAQFRVLLYHAHPSFSFSQELFVEHMDFLKANDYHTVTLDQFLDWKENNRPMPIRPLVLTLDRKSVV